MLGAGAIILDFAPLAVAAHIRNAEGYRGTVAARYSRDATADDWAERTVPASVPRAVD